ncbi:hypothetical protein DLAC_02407 [Tieghemostelium lacteum]|uniref:Transmembrane protein n=1 Tax=Tieghemostelium lacteum TaxID=361077 RepID=A0A152A4X2_TIELA|nr:hypothetical protein DLAC_02407 [Tieghemostelium lacteum]|eukprot:KYR01283.1 hypothetical protein DLAC_02407 [Tieghemostelium lacteum]
MNDLHSSSSSSIYNTEDNNNNNDNINDGDISSSPPLRESFQSEIILVSDIGPFNESIPILKKKKNTSNSMDHNSKEISRPLTKFRGLLVILLIGQKLYTIYFLIIRPLVLLPLIIIIPFYAINNHKTLKFSLFVALALFLNIIGDLIISFEFSLSNSSNGALFDQVFHIFSIIFYLLSRLFYVIAFIIGVGKKVKLRLFHSIPFYTYAATMVLLMVFSKQIAPIIIKPSNQTIITTVIASSQESSSGDYHDPFNSTELSLVVIYAFIEATLMWRSLPLSYPGYSASRQLIWLGVLGSTVFGITDTLTVISFYYYPLKGIFYYNTIGIWLGNALILFSVPRRIEVRDYIFQLFKSNKSPRLFKNSKSLLINQSQIQLIKDRG